MKLSAWLESHGLMIQTTSPRDEGTFSTIEPRGYYWRTDSQGRRILDWWAQQGGEGKDPLWEGRGSRAKATAAAHRLMAAWEAEERNRTAASPRGKGGRP